jgi:hypothetical protein
VSEEVVVSPTQLPVAVDFQADAGKGLEGADSDSYAIPFLVVLQPLSPIVVDGQVPNAKPGLFMNSVTHALYTEPLLVPCAFQRRWVRWAPRDTGGGFKGEFSTAQVNELRQQGKLKDLDGRLYFPLPDGTVHEKKCDRVSDTRNHYCLVLTGPEDEMPVAMVFALASTGIKTSKNLISRIDSIKMRGANGQVFTPPSFSHMYRCKAQLKSNEKGKWYLPDIDMLGPVRYASIYAAAKAFYAQVAAGKVEVAHDSVSDAGDSSAPDDGRM